ncbi:MAG: DUF4340 domain-containing protein [bacterium]
MKIIKDKRPLIYLAIAVAAAIVVLFIENPDMPRVDDASRDTFIPEFDSALVARIEVTQLLEAAALEREGEDWKVTERISPMKKELYEKEGKDLPEEEWKPAERARVSHALGGFGGLNKGIVVSQNPDNQELFQVKNTGVNVLLLDKGGDEIAEVVIGKNGPDYGSTYVRRSNEDKVYLVDRALVGLFSPVASDWLAQETQKNPAEGSP